MLQPWKSKQRAEDWLNRMYLSLQELGLVGAPIWQDQFREILRDQPFRHLHPVKMGRLLNGDRIPVADPEYIGWTILKIFTQYGRLRGERDRVFRTGTVDGIQTVVTLTHRCGACYDRKRYRFLQSSGGRQLPNQTGSTEPSVTEGVFL